ncbi:type II secretion system secretin GspD [Luminiphilus sp.]|jgi:general secretion pathway protein D|nr:type II secretion system secretin GspD [Luminiphilus sp.]MDB2667145.1 type II secretion system secretin GspD [Luminiphilus sp.]MDC0972792.1 type II secretion system secretin GspD [Luminiphilus sp.]
MRAMLGKAKGLALTLSMSVVLLSSPSFAQDFTVNLKDTDIQEFIEFVSDVTGTTIVIDPSVKGKVKVVSSKPVSKAELYDLFLSILDVHGYTAVRSGGVVRVIPNKNARSAPVDVISGTSIINDEYVTQVIRLENVSAAKLIPVLRPLVPQQAHMAAYAPSNAIIISDVRANINRISEIIDRMDESAVKETEIIQLRYGVATDVVEMLKALEKSRAGEGADANDEATLVADKRTNSVIVTADEVSIERINGLIDYLDIPLEQSGNVRVRYLEYADATEVAEVLTRVMQNLARLDDESRGQSRSANAAKSTIEADASTNSLIMTADTDEMAALESVIGRLDIRRAQVLVEAIIVEMEIVEGRELGLQWLFANDSGVYGSSISTSSAQQARNAGIAQALLPEDSSSTDIGVRDLAGALAQVPGSTFGWGVVDEGLTMTTILNALQSQGNANILSTPSVIALDNEEAFITVGQQVPFVTGSYTNTGSSNGVANPFQTIQRENVGVTLQVTPQINEGDSVVMDIVQEVSSISQQVLSASDVITNERKIETKVMAQDGDIVVLGGLVKDDIQDSRQGVPVLSGIPVIGRLFRNDVVSVTKSNLLVFIRSTIIRDDEDLRGATAEKYRYIRDQQRQRRDQGLMFLDDNVIPVLPTWEDRVRSLPDVAEEPIDQ